MKRSKLALTVSIVSTLCAFGCSESDCDNGMCVQNYGVSPEYSVTRDALDALCQVTVGGAVKDMETDYVPHVTYCENGVSNSDEALKAQAVSARSVVYYKKYIERKNMVDGQADQVYSNGCTWSDAGVKRTQAATNATAGVILRYKGTYVCAFYVSGTTPDNLDANCKTSSTSWPQSNVTYNWGKSGSNIKVSPIGSVCNENRGCMSQNGATCLGRKGWVWENIARFFYGMDIEIVQTSGSCIKHPNCTKKITNSGDTIDDSDECFSRTPSENWFTTTAGQSGGSQFMFTTSGSETGSGTWKINMAKAGTYEIQAYVDAGIKNLSANAAYTVRANGANKDVKVNMNGKSGWISIGKFDFAAGGDQWVKLSDATGEAYTDTNGKRVVYDSLKFIEAASCKDACTSGQKQCSGNNVQTCTKGSSGCLEWTQSAACGTNEVCNAGACVKSCKDACTSGQKQCSGNNVQTCAKGSSGCLEWTQTATCGSDEVCQGGACAKKPPVCSDACTSGQKQCAGNAVQTCAKGSSGCLEWTQSANCASDEECSNGACVKKSTPCTDACISGDKMCSGNGVQKCEKGSSGCLEWSAASDCGDKTCKNGVCIDNTQEPESCTDDCADGENKCSGNGFVICGQFDDDSCLEWSDVTKCAADEVCSKGKCIADSNEEELPDECLTAIDGRKSTIIDETDACFVRSDSSRWLEFSDYGYENRLLYSYVQKDKASTIGTWYLNVKKSDKYKISVYMTGGVGDVKDEIEYTIKAGSKTVHPSITVTKYDNGWVSLGTFDLVKDELQYVRLDNMTDNSDDVEEEKRVLFDAIKIVPAGTDDDDDDESGNSAGSSEAVLQVKSSSCSIGGVAGSGYALWMMFAGFAGIGLSRRRRDKK